MTVDVDRYAVFGNPISQSKSPEIHRLFAQQTQQAMDYQKIYVELGGFERAATDFFQSGGRGVNITAPFKEDAFHFADSLSERASIAGAVNTLSRHTDGRILGDNTDGPGLVWDIVERLGWPLAGKNILVLGAGGAARGVLFSMLAQNPTHVTIVNRTVQKALRLADRFAKYGSISGAGFDALQRNGNTFDLIVNATSASLGGETIDLPDARLSVDTKAYDMVYSDEPTAFMSMLAQRRVFDLSDGFGMLLGQAAESFAIWRGVRPDVLPVMSALRSGPTQ